MIVWWWVVVVFFLLLLFLFTPITFWKRIKEVGFYYLVFYLFSSRSCRGRICDCTFCAASCVYLKRNDRPMEAILSKNVTQVLKMKDQGPVQGVGWWWWWWSTDSWTQEPFSNDRNQISIYLFFLFCTVCKIFRVAYNMD